jgi:hypothetical protein
MTRNEKVLVTTIWRCSTQRRIRREYERLLRIAELPEQRRHRPEIFRFGRTTIGFGTSSINYSFGFAAVP